MTILENKEFYKQDKEKYNIKNNKKLMTYIYKISINGYDFFTSISDLQSLIDYIVNWYEIKYPEVDFDYYKKDNFNRIKPLSKNMNINELIYRLPENEANLLKCYYRTTGLGIKKIYDNNGVIIGYEQALFMKINKKNNNYNTNSGFFVCANRITGSVYTNLELKKIINNYNINLEELLTILNENYSKRLEFNELKKCIYNHECDIILRKEILQLAALKILYSKNTIPEIGYERAKIFINEFKEKFNIDLSTFEIDEIINRNYNEKHLIRIKKYIKKLL